MKSKRFLVAAIIFMMAFFAIALTISFQIGFNCGKDHVIYTQEVYTNAEGFSVVIDGEDYLYK